MPENVEQYDTIFIGYPIWWDRAPTEHQLGAYTDCNHGQGLAIIHPKLYRHIYQENISKFARFAVEVWKVDSQNLSDEEVAKKGIEALDSFIKEIGLPSTLGEIGISDKEMLRKVADSSNITKGCAKQLSHDEIYEFLLENIVNHPERVNELKRTIDALDNKDFITNEMTELIHTFEQVAYEWK